MPYSMTAFASQTRQFDWGTATWELRSVNHRFLEASFRLPETVRDQEMLLRDQLRNKLNRGKVDCQLQLRQSALNQAIEVDLELAQQYISAATQISQLLPGSAPLSPLDIMRWPGILQQPEVDSEQLKSNVSELFDETLTQLAEDRQREGEKLATLLNNRLDAMEEQARAVREVMPDIIATQQKKLSDRLAELRSELNPERIEQELVLIAHKADVDEELDRLQTHIGEIRNTINKSGAIGRRLDFLMQELNREANTLGSKSIAHLSSQASVEMKVLIEQMREQIQNIE